LGIRHPLYFPGEAPIGHRIRLTYPDTPDQTAPWATDCGLLLADALLIPVGEQTLRKELADLGQDNEELFGAERADFLENERCVHREQLRRLDDRFLWKQSIGAIVLIDWERTVLCAL